ncbi:MAG TPA: lipoyl(octanoyl) transferase LipB [Dehalococcoidia bacterium]|nr:lipoyl(octanoyl) transferase LipB [Dehalococcoidia bacterium]
MGSRITLLRPGLTRYQDAWQLQRRFADDVRAGAPPTLILLEHPPTYTLGARGETRHLLATRELLAQRGAEVIASDRGGDVTFHGPGQLVAYPIFDLRALGLGPVSYVRALEASVMRALAAFGIDAERVAGRPGVWVGNAKIAAIGVRISRGVTMHGFALNVTTDLSWFDAIVPCGIADAGVTSMERLLGRAPSMRKVEDAVVDAVAAEFGLEHAFETMLEVAGGR